MRYVHHSVAHAEEVLTHQGLGEEVGDILGGSHEGDSKSTVLDTLADEVVTPVDVFGPRMVFGVVR